MTAAQRVIDAGYEDVLLLEDYSYDDALIGITEDGRAVYDFDKMVDWLMEEAGFTDELEAIEWIEYNTVMQDEILKLQARIGELQEELIKAKAREELYRDLYKEALIGQQLPF